MRIFFFFLFLFISSHIYSAKPDKNILILNEFSKGFGVSNPAMYKVLFCKPIGWRDSPKDSLRLAQLSAGRDSKSRQTRHKPYYSASLIQKMSDEQLARLVDYLFELTSIPSDLWNEVLLETAKRNISRASQKMIEMEEYVSLSSKLAVEKPLPLSLPEKRISPLSFYIGGEGEELSSLFPCAFPDDTSFVLELEGTQQGCFNMPAQGPIASPFGWRYKRTHKGIDIQLRKGDSVTCAFHGTARFAQKKGGYGNVVIVRHFNGLETVYAHLYKIKVKEGALISAGDLIGLAGSTGRSTGPHLHFEVRFLGIPVNPQYFISTNYGSLLYSTVMFKKNLNSLADGLAAFEPDTEFHIAEKGETAAKIANHYGITPKQLRQLNEIAPKQPFRVKAGMVLRVRTIDN